MFTATPISKFHSAFLYEHLCSSYRPFWDKCTKWPQTDFWTLKNLGTLTHGPIFELAISGHETWPLQFQKLHIYSLSTSGDWNWAYVCSTGSGFTDRRRLWKLPYLGMKLGHCQSYKSCTYTLILQQEVEKVSLFSLYGQRFPRYGSIFIFQHETWPLAKVADILPKLPLRSCRYTP